MAPNNLLLFLTAGETLPQGWGFPPFRECPAAGALRRALMFLSDSDGRAQLVRLYFGTLMAVDYARVEMAGAEAWAGPGFKPLAESPTLRFRQHPVSTLLRFSGSVSSADVDSMSGSLTVSGGTAALTLGRRTANMLRTSERDGVSGLTWPSWLKFEGGVENFGDGTHQVVFRPRAFDCRPVLDSIGSNQHRELHAVGLLDSFLSAATDWDRIAVAWLAAYRNERNVG